MYRQDLPPGSDEIVETARVRQKTDRYLSIGIVANKLASIRAEL